MIHDTFTVLSFAASPNPVGFAHTPVANPRGVGAIIFHGTDVTDAITSVGYGGVTINRVVTATDSATEPGKVYAYFLGKGVPTGTQTLLVAHNGAAVSRMAVCFTVVASSDIRVFSSGIAEANQANPSVTITAPREVLGYCGFYSGLADPATPGLRSNMSSMGFIDFGAFVARADRHTNPISGTFTMGYSSATDDVAFATIAIMEVEIPVKVSDALFLPPIFATATIERIRQEVGVLLSDTFAATTVTGITVITRLIQDNLAVADPTMPRTDQSHRLTDASALSDALVRIVDRILFAQDATLLTDKALKEIGLLEADRVILSDAHTAAKVGIIEILRLLQDSMLMADLRLSGMESTVRDRALASDKDFREILKSISERISPLSDQALAEFVKGELLRLVLEVVGMSDKSIRERSSIISDVIKDIDEGSLMRVRSLLALQNMRTEDRRVSALDKTVFERALIPLELQLASFDHVQTDNVILSDSATAEKVVAAIILRLVQDSVLLSDRFYLDTAKTLVDRLVVSDALSTERIVTRLAQEALRLEDVRLSLLSKEVRESLGLSDSATAQLIQATIVRLVQDALAVEDRRQSTIEKTVKDFLVGSDFALAQILIMRLVQEVLSLRDVRLSELDKRLLESLGLTDTAVASTAQVIARLVQEALVLTDRRSSLLEKSFLDFLVVSDFASALKVVFTTTTERLAQDSLLLTDRYFRTREMTQREAASITDQMLREASYLKLVVESVPLTDATLRSALRQLTSRDFILLEDTVQRLREMTFREAVGVQDAIIRLVILFIVQTLTGIQLAIKHYLGTETGHSRFFLREEQAEAFIDRLVGVAPK